HRSSAPFLLQTLQGCGGIRSPWWSDFVSFSTTMYRVTWGKRDHYGDWSKQPAPPPQPTMPDAGSRPAVIAMHVFDSLHFDLASAPWPPGTDSILAAYRGPAAPVKGPGIVGRVIANLSFLILPLAVIAWIVGSRRKEQRRGPILRWTLRLVSVVVV